MSTTTATGTILVAAILGGAILATFPVATQAQQSPAPQVNAAIATPEDNARATLRGESRIRQLHDALQVSPAEETLWEPVAKAMRENETTFRGTLLKETTDMKSSTAINDLKTFQVIADHHASGLRKFIPAFSALYDAMPAAQQKRADKIFGSNSRYSRM